MVLIWPGSLLGLILVGAVAAWALFRPGQQLAVVGSLSIWKQAMASLDRTGRRGRRVSWSWLALLAGATAGLLALARPVLHSRAPGRRVSMAVCPGAQLGESPEPLRRAVRAMLGRLSAGDRVRLLRPAALGGPTGWLSPSQAGAELDALAVLPVPAEVLTVLEPGDSGRHTYHFAPAGTPVDVGPRATLIELPTARPAVSIDAVGAAELTGGRAQVLVTLRNRGEVPWAGRVSIAGSSGGGAAAAWQELADLPVTIAANRERCVVREVASAAAFRVAAGSGAGRAEAAAFLARADARKQKVSLIGADEPVLRRFVEADETLEPAASPADADVAIANRTRPPAGVPCLVIDPPADPPGWRRGAVWAAVVLGDADVAADPVMRGVELGSVAVRRLRPWVASGTPSQTVLAGRKGAAIMLRTGGGAAAAARRVYVAFELSADNTNLAMSEAFVVFLANALRWLAPPGRPRAEYAFHAPWQAPRRAGWRRLAGSVPDGAADRPMPWPGLFRDEAGTLRAVSLVGVSARPPRRPPADAVADAPLPEPEPLGRQVELWPILAAAAVALWLAGWALRVK